MISFTDIIPDQFILESWIEGKAEIINFFWGKPIFRGGAGQHFPIGLG